MTAVAVDHPLVEPGGTTALPVPAPHAPRLASLDVMRGMVILAMLIVNNIGDASAVGYFWQHADWTPQPLLQGLRSWWPKLQTNGPAALLNFPILRDCTLADLVMPLFMLIIGIAIPFSAAAAIRRGNVGARYWLGVVRRGATIYALGWCIDCSLTVLNWKHNTDESARLVFVLGMNVLQLLGISFVFARLIYGLPTLPRLVAAAALFIGHWAMLRFVPQGSVAAGVFTEQHNASGYLYSTLPLFHTVTIFSWLKFNIVGMLSVPPAVATMTLGTWMGQTLRNANESSRDKIRRLIIAGLILIALGLAWSCDLPMNKPRWTPCYLLYCSGIGSILLATLFWLIDVGDVRRWAWPMTVLGVNAIGVYFLSIMAKIWLLNMPRIVAADGSRYGLTTYLIESLQHHTSAAVGSWIFTWAYVAIVWTGAAVAYHKRLIWKV